MNRRGMLIGSTILVSLCYSGIFYALMKTEEPDQPVLLQSEKEETCTFYWLQAGVFKEASSYADLVETLTIHNINVLCVPVNELTYVVIGWSDNEAKLKEILESVKNLGIEVIEKQTTLNESQIKLLQNEQWMELLSEVILS